ncbi:Z1 domain-containing protein [Kocuria coralli]|uniref:Z1 domain-containing protein n=1 Tax=Kocuria coralli TaxID=1461025 RepID=UPI001C7099A9|nr:Z1 domain-containing protein [Kocuria coralli]
MIREHEYTRAIVKALGGMDEYGPEPLLSEVAYVLRKSGRDIDEENLIAILTDDNTNSKERTDFHLALSRWDAAPDAEWASGTEPATWHRRARVLEALGFSKAAAERVNAALPPVLSHDVFLQDPEWDPWYTPERQRAHSFYWKQYEKLLRKKVGAGVTSIDTATTNVVSRLADPVAEIPYQAKGLVVGHVQSGKTANFTGVVAKAIDAGYRLIIVLTGTVELLRAQTQRRLDMELIGKENILGGRDENDFNAIEDIDYAGDSDADWTAGKFVEHGIDFSTTREIPAIRRLTGKGFDYKSLRAGLSALDFRSGNELRNPHKQVWAEENLYDTDVRMVVVKKNKTVLTKLVQDLRNVTARLDEIPALIIDDEADQASVNTINPSKAKSLEKDRTAINGLISELLGELKRGQYIGYTATPFANVFVSPDDSEDIFPKDFILSLTPPNAYMGGSKFHDLKPHDMDLKQDPHYSNEAAYVRNLVAETRLEEESEIREALSAFVLTGAIKLWRESRGDDVNAKHHTMLVHESVKQIEHRELANRIVKIWHSTGFSSPQGRAVMEKLFESDFRVVTNAREWGQQLPFDFEELVPFIGEALNLITIALSPVVIVNGDKENEYQQVDFDSQRVWRILVGGAKLSRGFTIEGLTVTYYRRRTLQADSLMQMGRWFGYRNGYEDLVRLYIARNVPTGRGTKRYDLYEAFQAIVEDEEEFREQLREFDGLDDDGEPMVRPIDVPPMVFQQLPWLKPTSPNKMYNAELQFMGEGGSLKDFPRQPERGDGRWNRAHFEAVADWVGQLGPMREFGYYDSTRNRRQSFGARVMIVSAEEMIERLGQFEWVPGFDFRPSIEMMKQAISARTLEDWAVLVPYLGKSPVIRCVGDVEIPVLERKRRLDRPGFSGSSFRQRGAIERIAGNTDAYGGPAAEELSTRTRGALLLTFAADPADDAERDPGLLPDPTAPEDIATLFSFALPKEAAPRGRIGFTVRKRGAGAIIKKF